MSGMGLVHGPDWAHRMAPYAGSSMCPGAGAMSCTCPRAVSLGPCHMQRLLQNCGACSAWSSQSEPEPHTAPASVQSTSCRIQYTSWSSWNRHHIHCSAACSRTKLPTPATLALHWLLWDMHQIWHWAIRDPRAAGTGAACILHAACGSTMRSIDSPALVLGPHLFHPCHAHPPTSDADPNQEEFASELLFAYCGQCWTCWRRGFPGLHIIR